MMKKLNIKSIYPIGLLLLLSACSPKFYSPNTQNVPLISEQGETSLTLTGNGNQVEFQGAYGVAPHISIMANGGLFIPAELDNGNGGSGKFAEIGGGYFIKIGDNFVFETYGLLGFGAFENHLPSTVNDYPSTKGDISANLFRYGIQPNFGFKSDHFNAAISTRIVGLNYSGIKGDLIFEDVDQVSYLNSNKSLFLIEPALTLQGGLNKLKLQFQIGYSLNLTNNDFRQDQTFATLGLSFRF